MKRKMEIAAFDYTGICMHCKCKLKTKKEINNGYCNECWERYNEEMFAIYGDEWYE